MSRSRDISIMLGATEAANTSNAALSSGTAGLDSALTIQIIDSSYIQTRQNDIYRDSGFVTGIIDSSYVSARAGGSSGGLGDYGAVNATGTAASATGSQAIAIGQNSVASNTQSIAIGDADATGTYSVGIGGLTDASGSNSVSIGYYARDGYGEDVAIGNGAYANSANPGRSVAIGHYAVGVGISIGAFAETTNNRGTAIGYGESTSVRAYAGNEGTAVGFKCNSSGIYSCSYGSNTTASGTYASAFGWQTNATNSGSCAIGTAAVAGTNGTYNVALGYSADALAGNSHAIGYNAFSNTANQYVLGNASISDLRCQDTSITAVSDSRDKVEIQDLLIGLDFVNAITPKAFYKNNRGAYYTEQYTLEQIAADSNLSQAYIFDSDGYVAATEKYDKKEFGFIAQDVAAQLPDEYSDARVSFEEVDGRYGFDVQRFTPGDMVPILWKALRELSDKHDQLQSDHDALLARVEALENA
jgi:hypothetical protein